MSYNKPTGPPPAYGQGGTPPFPNPQGAYPPPNPGYTPAQPGYGPAQPGYGQPAPVYPQVVAQPAVVVQAARLGESPAQIMCPQCGAQIITATDHQSGSMTWLAAGIICLVGCWAGCCLIPFLIDGCKDVVHSCPNCKVQVGTYRRL